MEKNDLIKVGLHFQKHIFDLQFSNELSFKLLEKLLPEVMALQGVALPEKFTLKIINKPIDIKEMKRLKHYAIGDGDQIEVVAITE